jgi:chromate transport protein ChrA
MDLNTIGESFMQRLLELAGLFVRPGTTAFDEPAAHIAMVENDVVRFRQ